MNETDARPRQMFCPECTVGKCGNCNGESWDVVTDEPMRCPCDLLGHPRRQP